MLFQSTSISALAAVAIFCATPSVAASHRRMLRHQALYPRQASPVSISQLQELQLNANLFDSRIQAYFASDSSPAVVQLQQEYQQYNSSLRSWLGDAMGTGAPSTSAIPSSALVNTASPTSALSMQSSASDVPASSATSAAPSNASTASDSSAPSIPASSAPSVPASSIQSSAPQPTGTNGTSGGSSGSGYSKSSNKNLAVYYGQTKATAQVKLSDLCSDPNVDIVILAFIDTVVLTGGYPTVNFGAACSSPSQAQTAAGATGLLDCPDMATAISSCQAAGKKVMLSIGGENAGTPFASSAAAQELATVSWNLFGGGKDAKYTSLRPFGKAIIDGFDIDNENQHPEYYSDFVNQLRTSYKEDASRSYYISAAPQCIYPDASDPMDSLPSLDFVWVQFYNNAPCNIGTSGFEASLQQWAKAVAPAKVYIGAPGCAECAGTGYTPATQLKPTLQGALSANIPNLGGVMLWDGAMAKTNTDGDYLQTVKSALG